MRCKNVLTRIDALRTKELPPAESEQVHEHLGRCQSCEDSVGDIVQLADRVRLLAVKPPRSIRASLVTEDHYDVIVEAGQTIFAAFSDRGLRLIQTGTTEEKFRKAYGKRFGRELARGEMPARLREQVVAAVSGEGVEKPAVDLEGGEFERKVLDVLTHIPKGEVRTYTWVAQQAGNPKAVRAVANVCARNVVPFVVPCHRVVPATGGVGKYAFGSAMKRALLRREGAPVEEMEKLGKEGIRFIGSKTTHVFCFPTCEGARRISDENRVPFHDEREAEKKGFRPCKRCQPAAA